MRGPLEAAEVTVIVPTRASYQRNASLRRAGGYLWLALGRVAIATLHCWGAVVLFFVIAVFFIPNAGALEIAQIRLGMSVIGLMGFAILVLREFPDWQTNDLIKSIWRPCIASAMMCLALTNFPEALQLSSLALLAAKTLMGATIFLVTQWALWLCSGREASAEAYLAGKIFSSWNSFGSSK